VLIDGKWAYNEVLAPWYRRPASRLLGRVIDGGAALASRSHASYRRYHRIEAQLPFSGVLPLSDSSRSSEKTAYMTSYSSPSWTRRYGVVRSRDFRVISSLGRDPASESPS
jgi:hypothetical protein